MPYFPYCTTTLIIDVDGVAGGNDNVHLTLTGVDATEIGADSFFY